MIVLMLFDLWCSAGCELPWEPRVGMKGGVEMIKCCDFGLLEPSGKEATSSFCE